MNGPTQIGTPPWAPEDIERSLDEFVELYATRPIKDNQGGMKAPHMFALWFIVRRLNPDLIVESGVWRGQSTWLLERASPSSKVVSIDLDLTKREFISPRAVYSNKDFSAHDWTEATDRSLAFFDDHQNAYQRLCQCKWFGFRNAIFEDNYPPGRGDCYSLKQAFANKGPDRVSLHTAPVRATTATGVLRKIAKYVDIAALSQERSAFIPGTADAAMLRRNLEIYCEFPPVLKTARTRWGDEWREPAYPTPPAVLGEVERAGQRVFLDEAMDYNWICYARLK